jgi:hypothetical protein
LRQLLEWRVNGNEHFYGMMSPTLVKVDNTAVLLKKFITGETVGHNNNIKLTADAKKELICHKINNCINCLQCI